MNITVGETFPSSWWRRFRLQHITLAAGCTLAAAALIATVPEPSLSGEGTSREPAIKPVTRPADVQPKHVFYVVGSEARRQELDMAAGELNQAYSVGIAVPPVTISAVVSDPDDEQASRRLSAMVAELMHYSPNSHVVDLR
jgi:hypothetical protein